MMWNEQTRETSPLSFAVEGFLLCTLAFIKELQTDRQRDRESKTNLSALSETRVKLFENANFNRENMNTCIALEDKISAINK